MLEVVEQRLLTDIVGEVVRSQRLVVAAVVREVLFDDRFAFDAAQVFYNLLNPSAMMALPPDYPAQDYKGLLKACDQKGVGSIGVRVLAGGALSGSTARHPVSMQDVAPIGSAPDFETDAANARRFMTVIDEGHAANLAELAIRYAVSTPELEGGV